MRIFNKDTADILDKISEWCVYLLIFALPFSKSIIEICIAVAIVALGMKKIIKKEKAFANVSLKIPLFVFLIVSCLSFINTDYLYLSLRGLISKYTKFVLLYFIVIEAIDTEKKLKNLLAMIALSVFIITFDGFIQYYVSHIDLLHNYPSFKYVPEYKARSFIGFPTASFPYPNDLAAWSLMILMPLFSVLIFGLRSWGSRIGILALFSPLFYLFVLTKARSAWLGLVVATILLSLSEIKKIFLVVLMLAVVASALFFINLTLPSDDKTSTSLLSDVFSLSSISDRKVMWTNSWKVFMKHPVIGNGLNTFYRHYANVREDEYKYKKGSYAHNCYLQMAAETGIVGLTSFLVLLGVFFITSIKRISQLGNNFYAALTTGLLAGIFAFLVHSSTDTNLYSLNLAALFWFSLGLVTAILRIELK